MQTTGYLHCTNANTYQGAGIASFASISSVAAFSSASSIAIAAAFSSALAAVHLSSSPNDASTGLVQSLAICPRTPHFLQARLRRTRPSSPVLYLLFFGLPGGLVTTGEHSLNPGSTIFYWSFPKSAGTLSA